MIYMIIAGYFEDDASDELTNDPVFKAVLNKDALASQPTVSRFFNRMDEDTLNQFLTIGRILRKRVYSIQMPQAVILDLDSTLLDAYGRQEGRAFNFHYQSNGYHPLVCYDGMTGDLIKIQLRDGTQYSCTGVVDFLQPVLDEYLHDYPEIPILLRGDSGFSTPDLYKQCEENGTSYVIRLKENGILRGKASDLVDELDEITRNNKVDYAVVYGEFMYKAKSWPYERRVVCKVEKPENQMVYMYTFVVTNMDSSPGYLIKFYCKRGLMENFIKEGKSDEEIERIKLEDTISVHEDTKTALELYARESGAKRVKPFVLVVCRDTTHAKSVYEYIRSDSFFKGAYKDKVLQIDSTTKNEDDVAEQFLTVEHYDNPIEIVIHVNMLKEGWDVTNLYTIVPLRAANARTLIEQSIGRGLRLPYGKRTGVEPVDRLNIVAHDKFQEIIDEANRGDSPLRLKQVILDAPKAHEKVISVRVGSQINTLLGINTGVAITSTSVGKRVVHNAEIMSPPM